MKNLYLRSCIALLCTAGVVACGGGGNLLLGGNVTGLTKSGLALSNNGGTPFVVALRPGVPNFAFSFSQLINTDANYNVTVSSQPTGAVCKIRTVSGISSGTGRATSNVVSIFVDCITNSYNLGGTASGDYAGLVLINGSDQVSTFSTATGTVGNFTFPTKVNDGAPYTVQILTAPTSGAKCTIINDGGFMGTTAINNVQVNCSTPNPNPI